MNLVAAVAFVLGVVAVVVNAAVVGVVVTVEYPRLLMMLLLIL